MATMNVSLPDEMKEWVEQQAATGRYANVSDYMRDLIRQDIRRAEGIAHLQAEIDKGRRGPFRPFDAKKIYADITSRNADSRKKPDAA